MASHRAYWLQIKKVHNTDKGERSPHTAAIPGIPDKCQRPLFPLPPMSSFFSHEARGGGRNKKQGKSRTTSSRKEELGSAPTGQSSMGGTQASFLPPSTFDVDIPELLGTEKAAEVGGGVTRWLIT